jgi:hypothetical protein
LHAFLFYSDVLTAIPPEDCRRLFTWCNICLTAAGLQRWMLRSRNMPLPPTARLRRIHPYATPASTVTYVLNQISQIIAHRVCYRYFQQQPPRVVPEVATMSLMLESLVTPRKLKVAMLVLMSFAAMC